MNDSLNNTLWFSGQVPGWRSYVSTTSLCKNRVWNMAFWSIGHLTISFLCLFAETRINYNSTKEHVKVPGCFFNSWDVKDNKLFLCYLTTQGETGRPVQTGVDFQASHMTSDSAQLSVRTCLVLVPPSLEDIGTMLGSSLPPWPQQPWSPMW